MAFTHLHGHSTFSFLEAIWKPDKIVAQAKSLWMTNIAITDRNAIYGAFSFYNVAKEEKINPIIWVELGFILNLSNFTGQELGQICILAKDDEWYKNIIKLTSFANKDGIEKQPKVDIPVFEENKDGLLLIIGGRSSWIWKMVENGESQDKIIEILQKLIWIFGEENVFLEIIAQDETLLPEEWRINKKILEISEETKIPCVVNNVYNYPKKEDKYPWEVALSIKDGTKMYDPHRRSPKWAYHIMEENEIREICKNNWYNENQINDWIENNNKIAEQINVSIKMWQSLFPNYDTPDDVQKIYDSCKDDLMITDE